MIEQIHHSENSLECNAMTTTTVVDRVVKYLSGGEYHKEENSNAIINQAGQPFHH